jgi:hypothetical protein
MQIVVKKRSWKFICVEKESKILIVFILLLTSLLLIMADKKKEN